MPKKNNAAPEATGSGDKTCSRNTKSIPELSPKKHSPFFLHVRKDGSELRFDEEPKDVRSVRVERVGRREYTRTWSKDVFFTVPERWFPTRPPGEGWVLDTVDPSERFSTWRRPARQGGV